LNIFELVPVSFTDEYDAIETRQQEGPIQRNMDFQFGFCGSVGFDAVRLVDTLCCGGCDLPGTLDHAKDNFSASFQSGKV
jgi:hypothetical protein